MRLNHPQRVMLFALIISVLLLITKFIAYNLTSSTLILSDAAESIINVFAGSFALFSIYLAARPKDKNHPYGHGKIEFFAIGMEGILILIAGILILIKAIYSFFSVTYLMNLQTGAILIACTGVVNYIVGLYLIREGKKADSITLGADGEHLKSDALSSIAAVAGLAIINLTNLFWLDSLLAVFVSSYVMYTGFKLLRKSVAGLMDETDFKTIKSVISILNNNRQPSWIDLHNLRIQKYGSDLHVDCHLTLPYYYTLAQVHDEVQAVENLVKSETNTHAELFIHSDPCLPACCNYCQVSDCEVRQEEFRNKIEWTVDKLIVNKKHFDAQDERF